MTVAGLSMAKQASSAPGKVEAGPGVLNRGHVGKGHLAISLLVELPSVNASAVGKLALFPLPYFQ